MPALLGLALLAGSMQAAIADGPNTAVSAPNSGMARVWFLRPGSQTSAIYGAAPVIYANGAAVGAMPGNAAFYRDFTPGYYSFTVQSYGLPNNAADTVQLAPGTQTYLEVQYVPGWEEGYAGGQGEDSHSFFVLNMSPQLAQAYIPTLTDLGQR
jgi:hypothetical protein